MGGYGAGRRKTHLSISECIPLDTSFLLKRKMLTGDLVQSAELTFISRATDAKGKMTETKHSIDCLVKRYGEESGEFSEWRAAGHVTFRYRVKQGGQFKAYKQEIPLVVTYPNYGGCRWWFLAPCCGRRCRVLYLPVYGTVEQIMPECRVCLGLHYPSQLQSYIERHKTYERHLLANYGYAWAESEYHSLRAHYLEITPEIEYLRQRSVFDMRMRMLHHLLSFNRLILRMQMRDLRSLRSEEDRQMYLDHIRKEHGESYALDLVRMVGISVQMERDGRQSSSEVFDEAYKEVADSIAESLQREEETETTEQDTRQAVQEFASKGKMSLRSLLAYKQQLEEDIERVKQERMAA